MKQRFIGEKMRKNAFTLAEVLITLSIIGVVAAITMPAVINDFKVKQTVTTVKRMYNLLSQAILKAQVEYGDVKNWEDNSNSLEEYVTVIGNNLKQQFKVLDDCGTGKCEHLHDAQIYTLNGSLYPKENLDLSAENVYKFQISDGGVIFIRSNTVGTADITIDINGNKAPNTMGRDIFSFAINTETNTVSPKGEGLDPNMQNITSRFFAACNPKREGWNCAAWIIHKENMDYLKCADKLTWNDKNTCK